MVSLLVTMIGYQLKAASDPQHAFRRLTFCGFLSIRALIQPHQVIALIERIEASCVGTLGFGDESWRHVQQALDDAGYLSWIGLTVGQRYVHRRRGGWI
jgi:hypothetical protein